MLVKGGAIMSKEMSRLDLLKQITVANFMVEDLSLYLNTHPADREVLVKYNAFAMQAHSLKQQYESLYGMLREDSTSPFPWQWINQPWPWEYEANFRLEGEEK
jgi:spore coat protein JB